MPTSASTGTKNVKSSGSSKSDKKDDVKQVKPDHAPKPEQTPAQAEGKSELNSPDGAPIKTDPDDVQPGDRADLPPMPPQDGPQPLADHNNSGVVHAVTRQGAHVSIAVADPDFEKKLREADPKHPSLPRKG
jgi:hypothetical protein